MEVKKGVTEAIAEYVVNARYEDLPQPVVNKVKEAITDFIGVALAGCTEELGPILNEYVDFFGGEPQATVIGSGRKTNLLNAALANGAVGHALDYDDWSMVAWGHSSVFLVPNILALGEYIGLSGQDIITAYVVGFEVESLIPWKIKKDHYDIGWHITGTLGSVGSAAAAAWLLKLDKEQTQIALSIGASLASGIRANNGTMTKPLHAGNAASNGIRAAWLAQHGYTAIKNIFEVNKGLINCFGYQGEYDWDEALSKLGKVYAITSNEGINIKPYPSCGGTAFSIDAVKILRKKYDFKLEDIEKIELWVNPQAALPLIYHYPTKGLEGKFSGEYTLARALVSGNVTLRDFSDEAVNEPIIKELMDKTEWVVRYPEGSGKAEEFDPKGVLIRLKDGTEMLEEVFIHSGMPQNPMPKEQFEAKFRDCASLLVTEDKIDGALALLNNLENLNDVGDLFKYLVK